MRWASIIPHAIQSNVSVNFHYYERYVKFIFFRINKTFDNNLDVYTENHHIIPICLGGSSNTNNLVKLTGREHYLAHWMLAKAFSNAKLMYAFFMMNNIHLDNKRTYNNNSILYESAKKSMIEYQKKTVIVFDNELSVYRRIDKSEFNSDRYNYATKNMLSCFDIETGNKVFITCDEYYKNKNKYIHKNKNKLYVIDNDGNKVCITPEEYKLNKDMYSPYSKHSVTCFDKETCKKVQIPLDVFYNNKNRYIANGTGYATVLNLSTNTYENVLLEEYHNNTHLYKRLSKDTIRINNGIIEKQIDKNSKIPDGWEVGCLKVSCQYCGRKFDRGNYSQHLKIHTDGKPSYTCEYCGRVFTDKGNYSQHITKFCKERPNASY